MTNIDICMTGSPFQCGTAFPSIAGSAICMTSNKELEKIKIENLKSKIMSYLRIHKRINIPDLSEEFDVAPRYIGRALNGLENEGKIRNVD